MEYPRSDVVWGLKGITCMKGIKDQGHRVNKCSSHLFVRSISKKMNDFKVFKLGTWNDLDFWLSWSQIRVTVEQRGVSLNSMSAF